MWWSSMFMSFKKKKMSTKLEINVNKWRRFYSPTKTIKISRYVFLSAPWCLIAIMENVKCFEILIDSEKNVESHGGFKKRSIW